MSSVRKTLQLGGRLMKIAAVNPTRLRVVLGTALSATDAVIDPECDLSRLAYVTVDDLLPVQGPPLRINLALFPETHASVSVLEFTCLALLLNQAKAKNVFEFGTYKGVSITQLALNLPENSRIMTLDLPENHSATQFKISDPED